jgi:hypothetical protein
MTSLTVETTNGKEIKINNIPQGILEYAEYYAELEADGMTPMSYEDWKRVQEKAEASEAEARKAYAEFYS